MSRLPFAMTYGERFTGKPPASKPAQPPHERHADLRSRAIDVLAKHGLKAKKFELAFLRGIAEWPRNKPFTPKQRDMLATIAAELVGRTRKPHERRAAA